MKYTGISIGPIVATLSEVRKPRHLWSASYLFSHLMRRIIEKGIEMGGTLVSPATLEELMTQLKKEDPTIDVSTKWGIGLYPDRAFFVGESIDAIALKKKVFEALHSEIKIDIEALNNYFNIMSVSIESSNESEAIVLLNSQLDVLELVNRSEDNDSRDKILKLISKRKNSLLFKEAFGNSNFDMEYLSLIATKEIKSHFEDQWNAAKASVDAHNNELIKKEAARCHQEGLVSTEEYADFLNEGDFYEKLCQDKAIKSFLKSYHKYFCVVQADGDNMGKIIANLQNGKLKDLSLPLIRFAKEATDLIKVFDGFPIYAGGDDLLFIAPVVSSNGHIFDLIHKIDALYEEQVVSKVKDLQHEGQKHSTAMSYGISINYYKYPLYEVLESARDLLFEKAKKYKNSIACELRKHSGSSLEIVLRKSRTELFSKFGDLIKSAVEENMVSAVAHKLRETTSIWQLIGIDEGRMESFFKKFMGVGEKGENEELYLKTVKKILIQLLAKREEDIQELLDEKNSDEYEKGKYMAGFESRMRDHLSKNSVNQWEIDRLKEGLKREMEDEFIAKNHKEAVKETQENIEQYLYSMLRIAKFINGEEAKDE